MLKKHPGPEAVVHGVERRRSNTMVGRNPDDIDLVHATCLKPRSQQGRLVRQRQAVKARVARRRTTLQKKFVDGDLKVLVKRSTRGLGPTVDRPGIDEIRGLVTGGPVVTGIDVPILGRYDDCLLYTSPSPRD